MKKNQNATHYNWLKIILMISMDGKKYMNQKRMTPFIQHIT